MFLCQMQHGGGMGWPMASRGFILSRYKLGAKTTGLRSQLSFDAAICWSQPSSHPKSFPGLCPHHHYTDVCPSLGHQRECGSCGQFQGRLSRGDAAPH